MGGHSDPWIAHIDRKFDELREDIRHQLADAATSIETAMEAGFAGLQADLNAFLHAESEINRRMDRLEESNAAEHCLILQRLAHVHARLHSRSRRRPRRRPS